jgi:predicted NBD/HSP70 family sugar kinase
LSPERIVIGGSVMRSVDWRALRIALAGALGGYLQIPEVLADSFLAAPALGSDSGVLGAIALAADRCG